VARWSIPSVRPCALSAARRCAARRGEGPARRRCTTAAGRRRRGGGGGTPFPAPRPPRHGNVAARAPVRARRHGAGRLSRYLRVAEPANALKARVLHERAWNLVTMSARSAIGFGHISQRRLASPLQCEARSDWGLVGPTNVDPIVQPAREHSMVHVAKSIATFGIWGPQDGLSIQGLTRCTSRWGLMEDGADVSGIALRPCLNNACLSTCSAKAVRV